MLQKNCFEAAITSTITFCDNVLFTLTFERIYCGNHLRPVEIFLLPLKYIYYILHFIFKQFNDVNLAVCCFAIQL